MDAPPHPHTHTSHLHLQPPCSYPLAHPIPHFIFLKKLFISFWSCWVLVAAHGIFSILKLNSCPWTCGILVPRTGIRLLTSGPPGRSHTPSLQSSNPGNTVPTTNLPGCSLPPKTSGSTSCDVMINVITLSVINVITLCDKCEPLSLFPHWTSEDSYVQIFLSFCRSQAKESMLKQEYGAESIVWHPLPAAVILTEVIRKPRTPRVSPQAGSQGERQLGKVAEPELEPTGMWAPWNIKKVSSGTSLRQREQRWRCPEPEPPSSGIREQPTD